MGDGEKYECGECGHISTVDGDAPDCCGKPMVKMPMDACVSAGSSAEHARPMDEEEPCDDGRAG